MKLYARLRTTSVILHHFEEDECQILCDTQKMESNTIRNNIVLAIDVVALEKKTEYCHQYYETHATYCTFIERMTVENLLILPSKCVILRLKVIGSQPNAVVLLRENTIL